MPDWRDVRRHKIPSTTCSARGYLTVAKYCTPIASVLRGGDREFADHPKFEPRFTTLPANGRSFRAL